MNKEYSLDKYYEDGWNLAKECYGLDYGTRSLIFGNGALGWLFVQEPDKVAFKLEDYKIKTLDKIRQQQKQRVAELRTELGEERFAELVWEIVGEDDKK